MTEGQTQTDTHTPDDSNSPLTASHGQKLVNLFRPILVHISSTLSCLHLHCLSECILSPHGLAPYLYNNIYIAASLVQSRLDYANSLLYGISSTNIARLQRAQITAALIVSRNGRTVHLSYGTEIYGNIHLKYLNQFMVLCN